MPSGMVALGQLPLALPKSAGTPRVPPPARCYLLGTAGRRQLGLSPSSSSPSLSAIPGGQLLPSLLSLPLSGMRGAPGMERGGRSRRQPAATGGLCLGSSGGCSSALGRRPKFEARLTVFPIPEVSGVWGSALAKFVLREPRLSA